MPWQNSFLNFFENIPLQIGFQQMDSEKIRKGLEKYMVPNSYENNISGITNIHIAGDFTSSDFSILRTVFENTRDHENQLIVQLEHSQNIIFEKTNVYSVTVTLKNDNSSFSRKTCKVENILLNIN